VTLAICPAGFQISALSPQSVGRVGPVDRIMGGPGVGVVVAGHAPDLAGRVVGVGPGDVVRGAAEREAHAAQPPRPVIAERGRAAVAAVDVGRLAVAVAVDIGDVARSLPGQPGRPVELVVILLEPLVVRMGDPGPVAVAVVSICERPGDADYKAPEVVAVIDVAGLISGESGLSLGKLSL
jgi:hypothetical protein